MNPFKKEGSVCDFRTACYMIKQRNTTLVALLLQKEERTTMQWSLVKTFKFVFIV